MVQQGCLLRKIVLLSVEQLASLSTIFRLPFFYNMAINVHKTKLQHLLKLDIIRCNKNYILAHLEMRQRSGENPIQLYRVSELGSDKP